MKFFPFRVAILSDLQLFDTTWPSARVRGFEWTQAALFHPLMKMLNSLLKLLRSDLNPLLEHAIMFVAFAPTLEVDWLEQPHLLE